jgi:hypothetical protein
MILSYILIAGNIPLEPAVTKAPRSRIAVGGEVGFCESLYHQFKLAYPLDSRSTWIIPLEALAVPETSFQLDSSTVHMTYQIASPTHGRWDQTLGMSLLQVCKQLYIEGVEIFYGKNTFSFPHDFRIPTAATFLRDRPATSLCLIKSLELSLMDTETLPDIDNSTRYSGRHVLQCDYGFFDEFCGLLSSPGMQLRRLSLSIETSQLYLPGDVYPVLHALGLDDIKWTIAQANRATDVVEWVYPLLNITSLDHLSVFWMNEPHTRVVGRTVALMSQHMLRDRPSLGTNQISTAQDKIEIMYRAATNLPSKERDYAIVVYDPVNEGVTFRACDWDDSRTLLETADGCYVNNYMRPERPYVQEYLDVFNSCITCYCELNAT